MLSGCVTSARPGNALGAAGAAALTGALGTLVNLRSLGLGGTWNVEWAVPSRGVRVRGVERVWRVCLYGVRD